MDRLWYKGTLEWHFFQHLVLEMGDQDNETSLTGVTAESPNHLLGLNWRKPGLQQPCGVPSFSCFSPPCRCLMRVRVAHSRPLFIYQQRNFRCNTSFSGVPSDVLGSRQLNSCTHIKTSIVDQIYARFKLHITPLTRGQGFSSTD